MESRARPEDTYIWWDWGGVLGGFDADIFCESLARALGTSSLELSHFILRETRPSIFSEIEIGLTEEQIREKFCRRFKTSISAEEFCNAFNGGVTVGTADKKSLPLMQEFHAYGFRQGLISNMNFLHGEFIKSKRPKVFDYLPLFRRFFSYEIGFRKGRKQGDGLFRVICNQCGALPENSFLIDDRQENIDWFNALGGMGILFISGGFQQARYEILYELSRRGIIDPILMPWRIVI